MLNVELTWLTTEAGAQGARAADGKRLLTGILHISGQQRQFHEGLHFQSPPQRRVFRDSRHLVVMPLGKSDSYHERLFVSPARRPKGAVPTKRKKANVVEHPEVFDHVGLLVNEPPGKAGLPFI